MVTFTNFPLQHTSINDIKVPLMIDEKLFFYIDEEYKDQFESRREYKHDPYYFQECYVTPRALITMIKHSINGGKNEILGFLYGQSRDHKFFLTEALPTSVIGTETRVNATDEANTEMFMVMFRKRKVKLLKMRPLWIILSASEFECWDGITPIHRTAAGSLVSILLHKDPAKMDMAHLQLWLLILFKLLQLVKFSLVHLEPCPLNPTI